MDMQAEAHPPEATLLSDTAQPLAQVEPASLQPAMKKAKYHSTALQNLEAQFQQLKDEMKEMQTNLEAKIAEQVAAQVEAALKTYTQQIMSQMRSLFNELLSNQAEAMVSKQVHAAMAALPRPEECDRPKARRSTSVTRPTPYPTAGTPQNHQ